MAFPTTSVLDNFNRADNADLGANWTTPVLSGDSNIRITSNQAGYHVADAAFRDEYWNVETFGPDCETFCTVSDKQSTNDRLIWYTFLRVVDPGLSTVDGYYFEMVLRSGNDDGGIYRLDNGAFTQLGATITQEITQGDGLGLEAIGSTIQAYRRSAGSWSSLASRTDSTYTAAGNVGIGVHGDDTGVVAIDDWGGGTVVSTISANLSGTGSLSGAIAIVTPISASLSGTGALSAAITVLTPVTASLTGVGSLGAAVTVITPITGSLSGSGTLTADVTVVTPIAAALSGTGTLTADVTIISAPAEEEEPAPAPAPGATISRIPSIIDIFDYFRDVVRLGRAEAILPKFEGEAAPLEVIEPLNGQLRFGFGGMAPALQEIELLAGTATVGVGNGYATRAKDIFPLSTEAETLGMRAWNITVLRAVRDADRNEVEEEMLVLFSNMIQRTA